ncbi:MAG TPA: hypothetical protein VMD30_12980 [Tepidisphaeraceae bacterium]|nr:hypothetical protein [Tepidisphaeraceae bacterium]
MGRSEMRYAVEVDAAGAERREFRRHDMESQGIAIERWDGRRRAAKPLGKIMDISAGGVRLRTERSSGVRPDQQIRVRLELPAYAGISPFIINGHDGVQAKQEWVGWMTVSRVVPTEGNECDVAGRLVDMDEMDRGMLGLYLSTQPLAA